MRSAAGSSLLHAALRPGGIVVTNHIDRSANAGTAASLRFIERLRDRTANVGFGGVTA